MQKTVYNGRDYPSFYAFLRQQAKLNPHDATVLIGKLGKRTLDFLTDAINPDTKIGEGMRQRGYDHLETLFREYPDEVIIPFLKGVRRTCEEGESLDRLLAQVKYQAARRIVRRPLQVDRLGIGA